MIHTCPERMWYVDDFLMPDLLRHRIDEKDIDVFIDTGHQGTLESCMKSFLTVPNDDGGIWHLQDDILVCRRFKSRTEALDDGIVCGIATKYDRERSGYLGEVPLHKMWYSFPCIRIPNKVAIGFATWYYKYIKHNPIYKHLVKTKKHDDVFFRMYIEDYYNDKEDEIKITNASPNLVEHVDWLIGGSTINLHRDDTVRALYFDDDELVEGLKNVLVEYNISKVKGDDK